MSKISEIIKALFAGGSSYVYLAFIGGAIAFAVHYADVKADRDEARLERDAYKEQSESKDETIASQARSQARRDTSSANLSKTEDELNALPQTTKCSNSEPVRSVISGLFNNQNADLAGGSE